MSDQLLEALYKSELPRIRVHVTLNSPNGPAGESFHAVQIGENFALVNNIPFFADNISLYDIVEIRHRDDQIPEVVKVVNRSTYKLAIEYSASFSENFKELSEIITKAGGCVEGCVSGFAMVAFPRFFPLETCKHLMNSNELIKSYQLFIPDLSPDN